MITHFGALRRWPRRFGALILLLSTGALFDRSAPHAEIRFQAAPSREEADNLLKQALTAVNSRDPHRIHAIESENARTSFAWITTTSPSVWQADLLTVPNRRASQTGRTDSPTYLAVFHTWHTCESDGDHIYPMTRSESGWKLGPEIPESDPGGFRVRDHDLQLTLHVPAKTAIVADRVRIERTVQSIPSFCLLRLSPDFHVTRCTMDGVAVAVQRTGSALLFLPPAARTFTLDLQYEGQVDHQGSDYILPDEATLNSYWYPHTARLPATSTITVTTPPGWTAVAQGELRNQQRLPGGEMRVTYRNDLPNSFFTVDLGRYHITRRNAGGRQLAVYLIRDDPAHASACLDRLQRALTFFESRFSPLPYTHYADVETRGEFDGALEAYSFATLAANEMPGTIAHELSHTWWGGLIPCTYTRSMWNEAFAVYSDALFNRLELQQDGESAYSGHIAAHQYGGSFDTLPLSRAFDTNEPHQVSIGYDKGGRVLRVLEDQIGQETLLRCLRAFLAEHRTGEAADWDEFERVVNRVTGQDLGWFFTQWIDHPGLPTLRLSHVTAQPEAGGYRVEADIIQSAPSYRLRVPVSLQSRDGAATATVEAAGPTTHLSLHSATAPTRLTLDPQNHLPLTAAEGLSYDFTRL